MPPGVEVISLPRPPDPRDLFDFSGARELIDASYELACAALDRAAVPDIAAARRRRFRRPRRPAPSEPAAEVRAADGSAPA